MGFATLYPGQSDLEIKFNAGTICWIGVGKATNLPFLRTVQAVLPHTALQSAVSISGQIDDLNLLQGASVIATE
jgi:hypothetical protein